MAKINEKIHMTKRGVIKRNPPKKSESSMNKIRKMVDDNNVSFDEFYDAVRDIGNWDRVNSTDTIHDYINEMVRDGVHVSHIVKALEEKDSENDLWEIWLGNSMETPTPINTKKDLYEALFVN